MKKSSKISVLTVSLLVAAAAGLGAAWTSKRLTSNAGDSYNPAIVAAGSKVYVAWYDNTPGNNEIYFRRSLDSGATWETSKRLTNNAGDSQYPDIAVSGANVYVVWQDYMPGNSEIYFRHSADDGATWEAVKRLTNLSNSSEYPKVAAVGPHVYVVWKEATTGNEEIYFLHSGNSGASWLAAKRLTYNSDISDDPTIAASQASVFLSWTEWPSMKVKFKKSDNRGTSWQATLTAAVDSSSECYNPVLAVGNDNIYLAWESRPLDFGDININFSKSADGGSTWSAPTPLNTFAYGTKHWPRIAASASAVYVVWYDGLDDHKVYFKKSPDGGDSWDDAQQLTSSAGSSTLPDVAMSWGQVYVAYDDDTPGNYDIYVKKKPL